MLCLLFLARWSGVAERIGSSRHPARLAAVPQSQTGKASPEKTSHLARVESQCSGSQTKDARQKGVW